ATLFAPNKMHNLYLDDWILRFPQATTYAPFMIKNSKNFVRLSRTTVGNFKSTHSECLDIIFLEGVPAVKEYILFHAQTKTLIVTDCIFNLKKSKGIVSNLMLRANDALNKTGPSRLFRSAIKDKQSFSTSLHEILERDFDSIVLSHGDNIEIEGKTVFRKCFSDYL
ncbi:MAG: hypothetical protein OEZ47_09400, partial [Gammaproteobacteria bacterium]|nr:hypothetical protein [Gammaproteobacteria bacterium]